MTLKLIQGDYAMKTKTKMLYFLVAPVTTGKGLLLNMSHDWHKDRKINKKVYKADAATL